MTHRATKHNRRNTKRKKAHTKRKNAGMLRAIATVAALLFISIYGADGHRIYTVCRGNTCRSPYYETILRLRLAKLFPTLNLEVASFGTAPKTIGSKMAPETLKYATAACAGDTECLRDINAHSSRGIDCREIKGQIENGESIIIIPMDNSVEDALEGNASCFTLEERGKISIFPSANITDPFPAQGTPYEREEYEKMKYLVEANVEQIIPVIIDKFGIHPVRTEL